ncbi:hypothetical protein PoB_001851200 [Plakobranchus ocellatus]|uniref:Uncharacterized protein n=1 Tax=Plakobranchus ocellatus TaxID=259542 RepID=A0AAV3ZBX7_9GAST|nr:hypothetical protein PoB_001851200 [Plakobranchus ocellatus]
MLFTMSGKLGWAGAYNRPQTLGPITTNRKDEENGNSIHTQCERGIKILRAENAKLKKEYDELNSTLKQLLRETSHEKFDERRINLLKLQIIQLERQVAVLNEALGSRHEAALEVENTMAWLADKLRSYISAEVKGPLVPIARADLMTLVESSESARIKLFKAIERSGKESVGKDLLYLNPFIGGKYSQGEQVSLLDISLNRMDYINLRHVARLESKLCVLYQDLIRVFGQLEHVAKSPACIGRTSGASSRLNTTILKTCMTLRDAADDLLALSLLCPSSPWPALKRPVTKQVPVERITSALPTGLPRLKQEEITHLIEASIGICNHRYLLLEKEKAVLKEELNFHRATHDLQVQFMQSLFEAVRKGYGEFEKSAKETIAAPIKTMLDAYKKLKESASEDALREFLLVIKDNEEQLCSVDELLEAHNFEEDDTGALAFSRFGSEFFSKLDALVELCQRERDLSIKARKDVAEEQRRKDTELQQLIEDLEIKYEKQWNPISKRVLALEKEIVEKQGNESSLSTDLASVEISSSRKSSAETPRSDLTILRSYLYVDNEDSNTTCKGASNMPSIDHTKGPAPQADSLKQQTGVRERKPVKKGTKWKPEREWVNDFSGSVEKDEASHSESDNWSKPKKVKNKKTKEWESQISQPSWDLANQSDIPGTFSHDQDPSRVQDVSSPSLTKNKKPPLSYEPRLYVANRTLKLRRAGSFSSGASSSQAESDSNIGQVLEEAHDTHTNVSQTQPKSAKSKDSQLKLANINKRNSWR